jgi:hypothetical protein
VFDKIQTVAPGADRREQAARRGAGVHVGAVGVVFAKPSAG